MSYKLSEETSCPYCRKPVSFNDLYCTRCGFKLQDWIVAQNIKENPDYRSTLGQDIVNSVIALVRPTPVMVAPSSAVFLERQPRSLGRYLVGAVGLFLLGMLVTYGGDWLTYIGFTIAGYAVPLIVLMYIVKSDVYEREPFAIVAYCFGWGAFSGILAGILNALITSPFLGVGGAGFIEEPLKIYGVYKIAKSSRMRNEFNDHLDGIIYGAAAGAGFAGLENFWYLSDMILNNAFPATFAVLIRSITGVMHIGWSAIAGRSIGVAKVTKGYVEARDLIPGVLVAAVIHFLWNSTPGDLSLFLILPFTLAGLINMIKAAVDDERRWGFEFFAPDED
jgi:RsiW-degrading membrane proteinase PrsW (M82 family)